MGIKVRFLVLAITAMFVVHTAFSQTSWRRTYGGSGSDDGWSVIEAMDGSFVVCGSTGSFGAGSSDIYVLELDPLGDPIWSRTFGSIGVETGRCVKQTSDGGFIIAGSTNSIGAGGYDGYLLRLDTDGELLWQRTYGGADWDRLNSIALVDDGYYISGSTFSVGAGGSDGWVLRVDDSGNEEWSSTIGGAGEDEVFGVRTSLDGGAVIAMVWEDAEGDRDAVMAKLDGAGGLEWTYPVDGDSTDVGYDIAVAVDGYVMCTSSASFSPYTSFVITKVDAAGGLIWQQLYSAPDDYAPRSIVGTPDGGFALAGSTRAFGFGGEEGYFMLIDGLGAYVNGTTYGTTEDDVMNGIAWCTDGGFVLCGSSDGPGPGPRAVFVVKTDSVGFTADETIVPTLDHTAVPELSAYTTTTLLHPNPASPNTLLHFTPIGADRCLLADLSGRCVLSRSLAPGQDSIRLHDLEPGVYQVTFTVRGRPLGGARLMVQ